ncbi:MAG: GGDEF domain-containing protein [Actinomycetota bacterium]
MVSVAVGSLAAAGLGAGAVAMLRSADDLAEQRDAVRAAEAGAQLQGLVDELAWSHFDVVVDGVAGLVDDDVEPVDWGELASRRDELLDQLDSLAADPDVGEDAAGLATEIRDLTASGADDLQTTDLVHWSAVEVDDDGSVYLGVAPQLVAVDPAVALLEPRLDDVPDWARTYVAEQAEFAVEVPGWLVGDRDHPFADPFLPESVDDGSSEESDTAAEVTQIVELSESYSSDAASRLWDIDLWWTENAANGIVDGAPHDLSVVFADADVVADDLRSAIRSDDRVVAAERAADIESLDGDVTVRRVIAAMLALLAVVALVPAAIAVVRRLRALSVDAMTDPLTGAWNRRLLDSATLRRGLAARRHSVVAVTDLDRFKLVNDSWGHAVGDEVLRETVRRLQARVDDLVGDGLATDGWVIRSGGDEFVIVLASDRPIDTAIVVDRVRSVAGRVHIEHRHSTHTASEVDLLLSVGAVASERSTDGIDLEAMITAADLVAYEDKAARGNPRGPAALGSPPTMGSTT